MAYRHFESVKEWAAAQGVFGRRATLAALWAEHRTLLDAVDYLEKEDMVFIKREHDRLKFEVEKLRLNLDDTATKLESATKSLSREAAGLRQSSASSIEADQKAVRNRDKPTSPTAWGEHIRFPASFRFW